MILGFVRWFMILKYPLDVTSLETKYMVGKILSCFVLFCFPVSSKSKTKKKFGISSFFMLFVLVLVVFMINSDGSGA